MGVGGGVDKTVVRQSHPIKLNNATKQKAFRSKTTTENHE